LNPVSFIDLLSFGGKIPPVLVGTWLVMAMDNAGASETNVFAGATYAQ